MLSLFGQSAAQMLLELEISLPKSARIFIGLRPITQNVLREIVAEGQSMKGSSPYISAD